MSGWGNIFPIETPESTFENTIGLYKQILGNKITSEDSFIKYFTIGNNIHIKVSNSCQYNEKDNSFELKGKIIYIWDYGVSDKDGISRGLDIDLDNGQGIQLCYDINKKKMFYLDENEYYRDVIIL